MKMQKYQDMAYGNPRGLEWLNLMHMPNTWEKWSQIVRDHTQPRWQPDTDRPSKILAAAIWHLGIAHDSLRGEELRRAARRLRNNPPEWGAGVFQRGVLGVNAAEMATYGMPLEFYLLDNFLEHEIRPMMDSSTKVTS